MNQAATSPSEVFDTWAEVYDRQPNPLLSLEQRLLSPMLPDVRGLNVLDAGCGTGRWLQQLEDRSPGSMVGVDFSAEMLIRAAAKLRQHRDLRLGKCSALPVQDATFDLVLSSFVLSYLPDLKAFAGEVDRVTRPGANIFLTDMHPGTEASFNWKRSFPTKRSDIEIEAHRWSLPQIIHAFRSSGFEILSLLEPTFGSVEKQIFEESGRLDRFRSVVAMPAIYILQLRKLASPAAQDIAAPDAAESLCLVGARCALGADAVTSASLEIHAGYITSIGIQSWLHTEPDSLSAGTLDLSGYLLLPGLINAHEHLEFGLFPNIGNGPYQNAAEWAQDIHLSNASVIAQHRSVPRSVCLWWGAIRNLICGVTTVCHHNPVPPELLEPAFPVRVLSAFGWAHSLSLESDLARTFALTPRHLPFILHSAEGIDEKSQREIFDLDRLHALDGRTVLVHGLACTREAVFLVNERRAALILCPTSNQFLFHRSPTSAFIRSVDTAVLGSDSPLTAAGDLLDEIRFARMQIGLDAHSLYNMVTERSAKVFRLRKGEGRLRPGSVADVVAVRDIGLSPADTLAQLTFDQVELVILSGRIQLASTHLLERLPSALVLGLRPLEIDGHMRWIRAPVGELLTEAEKVLGNDLRIGGKKVRHATAS